MGKLTEILPFVKSYGNRDILNIPVDPNKIVNASTQASKEYIQGEFDKIGLKVTRLVNQNLLRLFIHTHDGRVWLHDATDGKGKEIFVYRHPRKPKKEFSNV